IAQSLNEQSLAADLQLHGPHHPDVADDYVNLGHIQTQRGHYAEAERYYRQPLAIKQAWYGPAHPNTADIATYRPQGLTTEHHYAQAEKILLPALANLERAYGKSPHPRTALGLGELGRSSEGQGNLDAAESYFERALAMYRAVDGDQHKNT